MVYINLAAECQKKVLMDKVLVDVFGNIPASANDQILMTRYQSNKIELVYLVVN